MNVISSVTIGNAGLFLPAGVLWPAGLHLKLQALNHAIFCITYLTSFRIDEVANGNLAKHRLFNNTEVANRSEFSFGELLKHYTDGKFTKIGMSPAHRAMFAGVVGITMSSQKSSIATSSFRNYRASVHCRAVRSDVGAHGKLRKIGMSPAHPTNVHWCCRHYNKLTEVFNRDE